MKAQKQLSHVWGVWFSLSSNKKDGTASSYSIHRFARLENWADFCHLWKQSPLRDPPYFFADPATGNYTKYTIEGEAQKVESINFFKDPIEPTWEYADNASGGYFNFSLRKEAGEEVVNKVYEVLVYAAMGSAWSIGKDMKGVRIVDTFGKNAFRCRFEIWMNYGEESLDKIKAHADEIVSLLREDAQIDSPNIHFYNLGKKDKPTQ